MGDNWVVTSIIVRLPFLSGPVGLPVLFRLQAKREDGKHELAAQLIALIAGHYIDGRIELSVTATTPVGRLSASQTSR